MSNKIYPTELEFEPVDILVKTLSAFEIERRENSPTDVMFCSGNGFIHCYIHLRSCQ